MPKFARLSLWSNLFEKKKKNPISYLMIFFTFSIHLLQVKLNTVLCLSWLSFLYILPQTMAKPPPCFTGGRKTRWYLSRSSLNIEPKLSNLFPLTFRIISQIPCQFFTGKCYEASEANKQTKCSSEKGRGLDGKCV